MIHKGELSEGLGSRDNELRRTGKYCRVRMDAKTIQPGLSQPHHGEAPGGEVRLG